jgi:hypothetical protein
VVVNGVGLFPSPSFKTNAGIRPVYEICADTRFTVGQSPQKDDLSAAERINHERLGIADGT